MKKNEILVICGPTASGKTALSVECAKLLKTEIISADSLLVYKGLDIGTAKPSQAEMQGVKHHLIDVVEPDKTFSVSDYENLALPIINNLLSEGKIPIISGGTGFYVDSILFKKSFGFKSGNQEIRNKYEDILKNKGKDYLFNILKEKDEATSNKLHPNDTKRVIRALEIYEMTGIKKSEQSDIKKSRFNYIAVMIDYDREILYNRINKRVDIMLESGLINEVQKLKSKGISLNNQSMQGIGYKEIFTDNAINNSTMSDIIKKNTRHYAKRQITYFKNLPNLIKIKPQNDINKMVKEVINLL